MVYLILQSFLLSFISIGIFSLVLFILGVFWLVKRSKIKKPATQDKLMVQSTFGKMGKTAITISSNDINAIAGDDILSTQLDLARAYIETGRKQLARKILIYVAENGNHVQQLEAKQLMNR